MLPTWQWELMFAANVLVYSAVRSGGAVEDWLAAAAVFYTFAHVQVANRLDEAEERRAVQEVACRYKLVRYLIIKEVLWVAFFVYTESWPALVGCGLFLGYPVWRRWYRS
jgi:hypothetical protein